MNIEIAIHALTVAGSVFGGSWYLKWFLNRSFDKLDNKVDRMVPDVICNERRSVYLKEATGHAETLKGSMSKRECELKNDSCAKGVCRKIDTVSREQLELWDVLNHHGHRGLTDDGNEVVRPT